MDGHAVSPLDLSQTLPVDGGLLVPYSLSGSPVIKQLVQWLLWCLARVGGFNQCASPNTRSMRLLISWLQSPSAVILEPKKIKTATVSIVSPSICHEVMELDAMILVF